MSLPSNLSEKGEEVLEDGVASDTDNLSFVSSGFSSDTKILQAVNMGKKVFDSASNYNPLKGIGSVQQLASSWKKVSWLRYVLPWLSLMVFIFGCPRYFLCFPDVIFRKPQRAWIHENTANRNHVKSLSVSYLRASTNKHQLVNSTRELHLLAPHNFVQGKTLVLAKDYHSSTL